MSITTSTPNGSPFKAFLDLDSVSPLDFIPLNKEGSKRKLDFLEEDGLHPRKFKKLFHDQDFSFELSKTQTSIYSEIGSDCSENEGEEGFLGLNFEEEPSFSRYSFVIPGSYCETDFTYQDETESIYPDPITNKSTDLSLVNRGPHYSTKDRFASYIEQNKIKVMPSQLKSLLGSCGRKIKKLNFYTLLGLGKAHTLPTIDLETLLPLAPLVKRLNIKLLPLKRNSINALANRNALESLNLHSCIGPPKTLSTLFAREWRDLTKLDLGNTDFLNSSTVSALKNCPQLKKLYLRKIRCITRLLVKLSLPELEALDISHSKRLAKEFNSWLQTHPKLRVLKLKDTEASSFFLRNIVKIRPELEVLDLRQTPLYDTAISEVLRSLQQLRKLKYTLGSDDKVSNLIPKEPNSKLISLEFEKVTNLNVAVINRLVESFPNLISFRIKKSLITEDPFEKLRTLPYLLTLDFSDSTHSYLQKNSLQKRVESLTKLVLNGSDGLRQHDVAKLPYLFPNLTYLGMHQLAYSENLLQDFLKISPHLRHTDPDRAYIKPQKNKVPLEYSAPPSRKNVWNEP